MRWCEFAVIRPAMATQGRQLLYEFGVGLGFLATVTAGGAPRVHPICPLLDDSGLYGFILPGPKLHDLQRDGRYALHSETCAPPRHDDGFYVTGRVRFLHDTDLRQALTDQFTAERELAEPWPGFDDQALVEFDVERALLTLTQPAGELPAGHSVWRE